MRTRSAAQNIELAKASTGFSHKTARDPTPSDIVLAGQAAAVSSTMDILGTSATTRASFKATQKEPNQNKIPAGSPTTGDTLTDSQSPVERATANIQASVHHAH